MDLEELENKPKDLPEQLWASVPRGRLLKPQNLTFEYLTAFSVTCRTKKIWTDFFNFAPRKELE